MTFDLWRTCWNDVLQIPLRTETRSLVRRNVHRYWGDEFALAFLGVSAMMDKDPSCDNCSSSGHPATHVHQVESSVHAEYLSMDDVSALRRSAERGRHGVPDEAAHSFLPLQPIADLSGEPLDHGHVRFPLGQKMSTTQRPPKGKINYQPPTGGRGDWDQVVEEACLRFGRWYGGAGMEGRGVQRKSTQNGAAALAGAA